MMELEQISNGGLGFCDHLDSLSSKYPWFVVQNPEDDIDDQILSTLHNPVFKYHCRIPELIGKRIRGCFHGWMILSNHPHNDIWSLWNTSTSDIISLPPLTLKDGDYQSIGQCCLSAPPEDPTSIILLTRINKPTFVFCRLSCKRNKKLRNKPRWTEMSYSHQLKRITMDGVLVHSLTCCNGKVYALNTDSYITKFILQVEIVVKDREVVIKLLLFGSCPYPPSDRSDRCDESINFIKGSDRELYYIEVGFHGETKKTPGDVYLYKLDTTSIKWQELEGLKNWDTTGMVLDETEPEDFNDLRITRGMWEEMKDLKDAMFFVDLARGNSIFYYPATASELGGYIHIRDKIDKVIYSYHINYQTIAPFPMPSLVLPTSHVSMLECRFEDGDREPTCTTDCKQEEDEIVVTSATDDGGEVGEYVLHEIPFDVLELIMKFCVCVEYMNFRATCKRCHLASPLIKWRKNSSVSRLQNYSLVSPWLMVVEKNRGILTFTDPMLGDNYYMKNSEVSIYEDMYCSRFGWLLFRTSNLRAMFFNPFTNDLRKLPESPYYLKNLCFSAPPTSPDCMVVGFTFQHVVIHFAAREKTWLILLLHDPHPSSFYFPTFNGRELFTLCEKGKLTVFKDLGKEDYSWESFEAEAPNSCGSLAQYFLVKCDQHVLLVVMGEFGEPIEVYKPNNSTREWEKINGIGKHMIYICDTTCLCVEAKTPEMENKIYLPRLCSTNKKIVFYSLETCTYHTFNGKSIQEELRDMMATTTLLSAKVWIEPTWSS